MSHAPPTPELEVVSDVLLPLIARCRDWRVAGAHRVPQPTEAPPPSRLVRNGGRLPRRLPLSPAAAFAASEEVGVPAVVIIHNMGRETWQRVADGVIVPHLLRGGTEWAFMAELKSELSRAVASCTDKRGRPNADTGALLEGWRRLFNHSARGVQGVLQSRASLEDLVVAYGLLLLSSFFLGSDFGVDVPRGLAAVEDVYKMLRVDAAVRDRVDRLLGLSNSATLMVSSATTLCYFLRLSQALHGTDLCGLGPGSAVPQQNPHLYRRLRSFFHPVDRVPAARGGATAKPPAAADRFSSMVVQTLNKVTLKKEGGASCLATFATLSGATYAVAGGCGFVTFLGANTLPRTAREDLLFFEHGEVVQLGAPSPPAGAGSPTLARSPPYGTLYDKQQARFCPSTVTTLVATPCETMEGVEALTLHAYQRNRRVTCWRVGAGGAGTLVAEVHRGLGRDDAAVRAFSDLMCLHEAHSTLYVAVSGFRVVEYDVEADYKATGKLETVHAISHLTLTGGNLVVSVEDGVQVFDLATLSLLHEEFFTTATAAAAASDTRHLVHILPGYDTRDYVRHGLTGVSPNPSSPAPQRYRPVPAQHKVVALRGFGFEARCGRRGCEGDSFVSVVDNTVFYWDDLGGSKPRLEEEAQLAAFRTAYNSNARWQGGEAVGGREDIERLLDKEVEVLLRSGEWRALPADERHGRPYYYKRDTGVVVDDLREVLAEECAAQEGVYDKEAGMVERRSDLIERLYHHALHGEDPQWERRALSGGDGRRLRIDARGRAGYYNRTTREVTTDLRKFIRDRVVAQHEGAGGDAGGAGDVFFCRAGGVPAAIKPTPLQDTEHAYRLRRGAASPSSPSPLLRGQAAGAEYVWRHQNLGLYRDGERMMAGGVSSAGSDASSDDDGVHVFPYLLPQEVERELSYLLGSGEWLVDDSSGACVCRATGQAVASVAALARVIRRRDYVFRSRRVRRRGRPGGGGRSRGGEEAAGGDPEEQAVFARSLEIRRALAEDGDRLNTDPAFSAAADCLELRCARDGEESEEDDEEGLYGGGASPSFHPACDKYRVDMSRGPVPCTTPPRHEGPFKKRLLLMEGGGGPGDEAQAVITAACASHDGVYLALHAVCGDTTTVLFVPLPLFDKPKAVAATAGGDEEEEEERLPSAFDLATAKLSCVGCVAAMIPVSTGVLVCTTSGVVQMLTPGIIQA